MPVKDRIKRAEYQRIHLRTNREFVKNYKESRPCMDCGKFYPACVMEFDHQKDKTRAISRMLSASAKRIYIEIEKCELVCANCHRIRHYIISP